ncbi:MAG: PilZ domain-containing protein [Methylococcales bacterium]|jgi:c-di-GMP-binding flagellar brake protein YcgR|nr:PilZ domain-containing protein [Methylococcales bacterium]MBT7445343.1 PilZ domain-containing protein [Methylococcales bacterium]
MDDEEDSVSEQRRHKRVHVDLKVGIIQSDNKMLYARIRDVSEGGVYVVSPYGADKGQGFKIIFQLQNGDRFMTVRCKVKVAYVSIGNDDVYGLGMQFTWVEPDGLKALKDFIRHRMSK